jgi:hypothetical protein
MSLIREILNRDGTLRAKINSSGDRLELYDSSGSLVAIYYSSLDETRDAYGSFVGRGDLMLTCLS